MNAQRMKWTLTAVVMLLLLSSVQMTQAESTLAEKIPMGPGSTLTVDCPTYLTVRMARDRKSVTIACAPSQSPTATPTAAATQPPTTVPTQQPTATQALPTSTPVTNPPATQISSQRCADTLHDTHLWHPAVHSSGCYFEHEHGDAPPNWVTASLWPAHFTHPGNTPNENILKHTSFKGFTITDDSVEVYVIMHLDTNPNGHTSRFHSYQAWAKDPSGGVSYWDLWVDFGDNDASGPTLMQAESCGNAQFVRPIMIINFPECPLQFETWYNSPHNSPRWGWGLGFSVSTQYYAGPRQGELSNPDLSALNTWLPTKWMNTERRIEVTWNPTRNQPTGAFYSTQFGDLVSGPNDPLCGTTRTYGSKTYTLLCLQQYIAPTMTSIGFPNNAIQKRYDATGVKLPN